MQPRIQMGLIVGVVGLFIISGVSFLFGFCGPVMSLIAGAAAGFLAANREKLPTRSEGAQAGATAGGIAGAIMILGQLCGGLGALTFMMQSGTAPVFGTMPDPNDPAGMTGYYGAGVGVGFCFGIVGAALAAGAGALTGALATTEQPRYSEQPPMPPV